MNCFKYESLRKQFEVKLVVDCVLKHFGHEKDELRNLLALILLNFAVYHSETAKLNPADLEMFVNGTLKVIQNSLPIFLTPFFFFFSFFQAKKLI